MLTWADSSVKINCIYIYDCNLLHLIAASTLYHPCMCTITYCEGFVQNPPVVHSVAMLHV